MTKKLNLTPSGASLTFRFNDVKVPAAMFVFHLMVLEPPGVGLVLLVQNMKLSAHA